jgi:hypothetical protein
MRELTTASLRHQGARRTNEAGTIQQSTATAPTGKRSAILLAFLLVLPSVAAQAQTETPAAPPADAPPAMPPPAAVPPPPPMPPPAPPSAVEATVKPPTSSEAMPATRPEVLPPIDVGAWVRAGSVFQKASDPSSLNDWHMDNAYVELHAGGKIHQKVSVTLNLNANMLNFNPNQSAAAIEDAIVSFDFADPLHVWVGHLLVPVDRSNASGPFFMIPWNYPGFLTVGPNTVAALPKEGPFGRNNGAVVWGEFNGGQLKYLVGAFDNADVTSSPLFSGRLNLALIGTEPGFWGNASYFGDKDILAVGVGGQFQKHGSSTMTADKDYTEVNADVLGEFKLGGGAWFTGEAAYYHYAVADMNPGAVKDSYYVLAALASGVVGAGNIQPMVRYQGANLQGASSPWNIDVALSYLIKGPALRVIGTYSHTKLPGAAAETANSVQFGAQAIFF